MCVGGGGETTGGRQRGGDNDFSKLQDVLLQPSPPDYNTSAVNHSSKLYLLTGILNEHSMLSMVLN